MASDPNTGVCLIRRVVIRNYKSIAACDVELGPLTFLVGPNGSGKSNFLDALRFVSDSLRYSLEHAVRSRGGMEEVLRRFGRPTFALRLEFTLPDGMQGHYAVEIGGKKRNEIFVRHEECVISGGLLLGGRTAFFDVTPTHVQYSAVPGVAPAVVRDRLYLVNLSGTPQFRPVYDALSGMGVYNLNPDVIRDLQPPVASEILARDGSNLPSVLANLASGNPARKARVEQYLALISPGISSVDSFDMGPRQTLQFSQHSGRAARPYHFLAGSMSDGTLRALGVLIALFQGRDVEENPLLVGIEEPETALHPAAAGVLIDSMRDATWMRQVLVTSHSPELLDNPSIADSEILAVVSEEGQTRIGHLDEAGRSVLRDHLFTAGDLLRMDQLRPDPAGRLLNPQDLGIFGTGAPA